MENINLEFPETPRVRGLKAFNAFDNSTAKSSLHVERCGLAHSSDISRLVPTGCDSTKSAEIFVRAAERQEGQYCRKKIGHVAYSTLSRYRHVSWKRSTIQALHEIVRKKKIQMTMTRNVRESFKFMHSV